MHRQPRLPHLGRLLCWAVLCAAAGGAPRPAAAQAVWELTPYRVQVFLAAKPNPELTAQLEDDLRAELSRQVDARIGAAWNVAFSAPTVGLGRAMIAGMESVSVEQIPAGALEFDKVLLLKIAADPSGYHVSGRELDVATRTWNTVVRATALHPAKLLATAFQVMLEAFAPLARIEEVEKTSAVLRLRAAAFTPRDPDCLGTVAGDLFQPVVRYNDREGKLRRVASIPWTFFRVENVAGAELKCQLHTGLRSPLSGRRRGRVEQLAVGVVRPTTTTQLVLRSRTEPDKPLVGYEIYQQELDSKHAELIGRTDHRGRFLVEHGEPPLRVLLVKSGKAVLARLPIVPGLESEITAPIPDDDQRLEAEGFINGFQEELVDLVTRREVLLARIRARIKDGKIQDAEALMTELRQMKNREEFRRDLDREQKKIFSADPVIQRKIDNLFADTRKLLQQYLDPAPIEQLVRELAEGGRSSGEGKS